MNLEIFEALHTLEKERGIPMDFMIEKIKKAIITGCKNNYNGNDEAIIDLDENEGTFEVRLQKTVVEDEEITNLGKEITLNDAKKIDPNAQIGDKVSIKLDTKAFGRIAAQTARNIIRQGLKDGERNLIRLEFQDKCNQIVSAVIEKIHPENNAFTLRIGKAECTLPKSEQIGTEQVKEGDYIKVYIFDVKETFKGPRIMISRACPAFLKKLFENEVPEIAQGIVEIKAISRQAGIRSKIAVWSNDPKVEAIGACIGSHGVRLDAILKELGGEKVDIIEYSESPEKFITSALSPASVQKVILHDEEEIKSCDAVIPDEQLSLAIGNRGLNAKLAAKLTGYRINLVSDSGKV